MADAQWRRLEPHLLTEAQREIEKQLAGLETAPIAGAAWRDHGSVYLTETREGAAQVMNLLAPEHLEVIAEDLDWWLGELRNYGSLFLGPWSTVVYADKGMSGTNHVLPTARGARYTGGQLAEPVVGRIDVPPFADLSVDFAANLRRLSGIGGLEQRDVLGIERV